MFTLAQVVVLLQTYGYFLIFPIAFVEGPIIAVICGWLAGAGILDFAVAYMVLIAGNLAGDAFYYALGYWGGPAAIKKWGHWFRLDLDKTVRLKKYFDDHGGKILLWAKIAPDLSATVILVGAGLARFNFWTFFVYGLMVEIPKTAILMLVGYFVVDAYQKIVNYFDYLGAIFSLIWVVIIVLIVTYYWRRSKKMRNLTDIPKPLD